MAVSLAVSEIFSIKGWRDLEIRVRVTQVHTIRKLTVSNSQFIVVA